MRHLYLECRIILLMQQLQMFRRFNLAAFYPFSLSVFGQISVNFGGVKLSRHGISQDALPHRMTFFCTDRVCVRLCLLESDIMPSSFTLGASSVFLVSVAHKPKCCRIEHLAYLRLSLNLCCSNKWVCREWHTSLHMY